MTEPERSTDETLARLGELARQAMAAQANLAKASFELGRASMSAEIDPSAAGRAWVEAVSREGAAYWREVGALGLDVAGRIVTLGSRSAARVMSETRSAVEDSGQPGSRRPGSGAGAEPGSQPDTRPAGSTRRASHHHHTTGFDVGVGASGSPGSSSAASGAASGAVSRAASAQGYGARDGWLDPEPVTVESADQTAVAPRRVGVTLRGVPGETARGTVTLSNQHSRARRVTLTPSDVLIDTGGDVRLGISVDPEAVTIAAMSEHDVQLAVDLLSGVVRPGERLVGTVEVSGGVEAVLDVVVEVLA